MLKTIVKRAVLIEINIYRLSNNIVVRLEMINILRSNYILHLFPSTRLNNTFDSLSRKR